LRALEGRDDVAILIDQEGGRVARMQPPEWPAFPAGAAFDALYEIAPISALEAARANAQALGLMLAEVGITVDCLPLLDVRVAQTHPAIGDRALGSDPMRVASLGRAVIDGLRSGGVVGVVKHMPGQGRAQVDSHYDLPVVDADDATLEADLQPFRQLSTAPMGMTGHIMFPAWDTERCSTLSPFIVGDIIRGRIGFDGLLMSDDLDMQALKGDVPSRAAGAVAAGCDIALNCWGRMDEMIGITNILPSMTDVSRHRLARAMATIAPVEDFGALADLIAKRDELLALV
jgi:beta-N-acetylhexosaminidase